MRSRLRPYVGLGVGGRRRRGDAQKGLEQERTGQVGEVAELGWSGGAPPWDGQYLPWRLDHTPQHPGRPHSQDPDAALQKFHLERRIVRMREHKPSRYRVLGKRWALGRFPPCH